MTTARGRTRSNRTKEQSKERQAEQVRRYSAAAGRALARLKRKYEDEYFLLLDEELPKVHQERGPLPFEEDSTSTEVSNAN